MSGPSEHAKLSPSGGKRWMTCPGSVELESNCADSGSGYADEGTAGHEIFSRVLTQGGEAHAFVGDKASNGVVITEELASLVDRAVGWVRDYLATLPAGYALFSEQKIQIGEHAFGIKPELLWGTSDLVIVSRDELCIRDLKLGYVDVPAKANVQLILYALGAMYMTGWMHPKIRLVIDQPRTKDEPKEWTYTIEEMEELRQEYLPKAHAAVQGGPLVASEDGCRFCKAAGVCPKLREETLALARREFSNVLTLSGPEIADLLDKGAMIENALKALRSHALKLLELDPESVPGYKRVQGEKHRAWVRTPEEIARAVEKYRVDPWEKSMRSPAQVEALLADSFTDEEVKKLYPQIVGAVNLKKITKKARKELAKNMLIDLAKKPEGEPTLARIGDDRPALGPAFTAADIEAAAALEASTQSGEEMID